VEKRRVRCPRCGSLDTKRKGWTTMAPTALGGQLKPLQRFLCRTCECSFTSPRKVARSRASFADDVVLEAVRLYVQALASCRVLAALLERRLGRSISRFTLNTWVDEIGGRAKTTLEVSQELQPRWGGFLGVDGKGDLRRARAALAADRRPSSHSGRCPRARAPGRGP
jgi:transposase-like protein